MQLYSLAASTNTITVSTTQHCLMYWYLYQHSLAYTQGF